MGGGGEIPKSVFPEVALVLYCSILKVLSYTSLHISCQNFMLILIINLCISNRSEFIFITVKLLYMLYLIYLWKEIISCIILFLNILIEINSMKHNPIFVLIQLIFKIYVGICFIYTEIFIKISRILLNSIPFFLLFNKQVQRFF